jgi:hypothetical protein
VPRRHLRHAQGARRADVVAVVDDALGRHSAQSKLAEQQQKLKAAQKARNRAARTARAAVEELTPSSALVTKQRARGVRCASSSPHRHLQAVPLLPLDARRPNGARLRAARSSAHWRASNRPRRRAAFAPPPTDYVPSESNPADIPSRVHEMTAREAAEALRDLGDKIPMVLPEIATPEGEWRSYVDIASSIWR